MPLLNTLTIGAMSSVVVPRSTSSFALFDDRGGSRICFFSRRILSSNRARRGYLSSVRTLTCSLAECALMDTLLPKTWMLTDAHVSALVSAMPNVTFLNISGPERVVEYTPLWLGPLVGLPQLTELRMTCCGGLTSDLFAPLCDLPSLHHVKISETFDSLSEFDLVEFFSTLSHIVLDHRNSMPERGETQ